MPSPGSPTTPPDPRAMGTAMGTGDCTLGQCETPKNPALQWLCWWVATGSNRQPTVYKRIQAKVPHPKTSAKKDQGRTTSSDRRNRQITCMESKRSPPRALTRWPRICTWNPAVKGATLDNDGGPGRGQLQCLSSLLDELLQRLARQSRHGGPTVNCEALGPFSH